MPPSAGAANAAGAADASTLGVAWPGDLRIAQWNMGIPEAKNFSKNNRIEEILDSAKNEDRHHEQGRPHHLPQRAPPGAPGGLGPSAQRLRVPLDGRRVLRRRPRLVPYHNVII